MKSTHLNKIYNQSLIIGIFSFLFLWDLKTFALEPRYFFILPFFSLILLKKIYFKFKKNYIILYFQYLLFFTLFNKLFFRV